MAGLAEAGTYHFEWKTALGLFSKAQPGAAIYSRLLWGLPVERDPFWFFVYLQNERGYWIRPYW
jgi:hypothetical protein